MSTGMCNHSLQSYFFQKEFFGELIIFRYLNMDFTIVPFNMLNALLITIFVIVTAEVPVSLVWGQKPIFEWIRWIIKDMAVIREELISIWAGIHKSDSPPCDMVQLTKEYYCSYDKTKETKKISKKHEATHYHVNPTCLLTKILIFKHPFTYASLIKISKGCSMSTRMSIRKSS